MGWLAELLSPSVSAVADPADDKYYTTILAGGGTASGVRIDADVALSIATVYACVRIISGTLAMLPLIIYSRQGEAKNRAPNHPLYEVIHDAPNPAQNSFQWRQSMMTHLLLRGAAYSQIHAGARGPVDQLELLNPDRVTVEKLENRRLRFQHRGPDGRGEVLSQDDVFHLMGLSQDGVKPVSVIQYARESFGLTYAAESFGARLFAQGALHHGVLKHPGRISEDAQNRLRSQVAERHMGLQQAHKPLLLQEGMEWQTISITPEDAQFLATRGFQVEEIASWFGVPLSLLQHTEKSTSWGTGLTQLTLGFLLFTMQPWLTLWESSINQQLILAPQTYFAEFLVEGLLRGDSAARAAFYNTMITLGIMTRNEARVRENLNPLPGLDEPLTPMNMGRGQQGMPVDTGQGQGATGLSGERARALETALAQAAEAVEREVKGVRTVAAKHAGDADGWPAAVEEFYAGHLDDLVETLNLPPVVAGAYCRAQATALATSGVGVAEDWQRTKPAQLAAVMLEGG